MTLFLLLAKKAFAFEAFELLISNLAKNFFIHCSKKSVFIFVYLSICLIRLTISMAATAES